MKQSQQINVLRPDAGDLRQQGLRLRSDRVRGWARWVYWVLAALSFTAIWQDRRLAPPIHDGMQHVVAMTRTVVHGLEGSSGTLAQSLHPPSASGSAPEFNAITRWLLNNRN